MFLIPLNNTQLKKMNQKITLEVYTYARRNWVPVDLVKFGPALMLLSQSNKILMAAEIRLKFRQPLML